MTPKTCILAHDLGTTGVKATLFNDQGHLIGSATAGYDTTYPQRGWAEQDPANWWQAVQHTTRELLHGTGIAAGEIAGVTFSGQMMACLPVDRAGQPLRHAIIWADQRAVEEAAHIAATCGKDTVYRRTGHRVSPAYSAAKILWVQRHQPDIYAATHVFLQAKDYIACCLTATFATDYSDASGTNAFDLETKTWAEDLCTTMGLEVERLPDPRPSTAIIGEVTRDAADATGLVPGTPVIIGGGDGACATAGAGVVGPGDAYNYIGSSAWIAFATAAPIYDPQCRTFTFHHLDPHLFCPMGTMQTAGGARDWLLRVLESEDNGLSDVAAQVPPGSRGLLFLPYLMGERSPHWNPRARGAFVGLTMRHSRAEMVRATLEGVAFNLRMILEALEEQAGPIAGIRLIGGGGRGSLWRRILADVFNRPLFIPELLAEATSWGAAVAGGVGVGLYPDFNIAKEGTRIVETLEPDSEAAARYDEYYAVFKQTYQALVPIYEALSTQR